MMIIYYIDEIRCKRSKHILPENRAQCDAVSIEPESRRRGFHADSHTVAGDTQDERQSAAGSWQQAAGSIRCNQERLSERVSSRVEPDSNHSIDFRFPLGSRRRLSSSGLLPSLGYGVEGAW